MARMRAIAAALCAAALAAAADISVIQTTAAGDKWAPLPSLSWGADFPAAVDVTVDRNERHQEIMGFGAALTDTAAFNFAQMNSTTKSQFIDAYFSGPEKGVGYTIARITINSADYSVQSFNYDNVTGDFSLSHFDDTLAYDNLRVVPLLKAIKAQTGTPLNLFGSPWSPPGWMKTNNNMIDSLLPCLKPDTASGQSYQATWANYIVRWLQAYQKLDAGNWFGITPQNEPEAQQPIFESCAWSPANMTAWLRDYLGPAVKAAFPDLKIMIYDHNKVDLVNFAGTILADPEAAQYADGVAMHWYDYETSLGLANVNTIASTLAGTSTPATPKKFMLATEACYLQKLQFDFDVGLLFGLDIIGDLAFNVSGWVEWSLVNHHGVPEAWEGGPAHDSMGQPKTFGDSALFQQLSDGSESLLLLSSYYIIGHVSRFARPGSTRVGVHGAGVAFAPGDYEPIRAHLLGQDGPQPPENQLLASTAFVSADGKTASVVVLNAGDVAVDFKLRDLQGARATKTTIPAQAVQTYTFSI